MAISLPPVTAAEERLDLRPWTTWAFVGENDAIAIANASDEHYTSGLRFFALRDPHLNPSWASSFAEKWCRRFCSSSATDRGLRTGFAFGQLIYSPEDITRPELIVDDRPYAAWLHGSLLLEITENQRHHAFELQLGLVGEKAGGEFVQTELHELIGSRMPAGWDNQLPTEAAINLIYTHRRRFGDERFDVVPHLGGALGTVMVMAKVGATVRAGWNISDFPALPIQTTLAPPAEPPPWELYFFAGAEGRALAHNIFLDGTVFRDSHSVDKEELVYDLMAGFSWRYKRFRFHYTMIRRSAEFSSTNGELADEHSYGSLTLRYERAF